MALLGSAEKKWTLGEQVRDQGLANIKLISEQLIQVHSTECEPIEDIVDKLQALQRHAYDLHKIGVLSEKRKALFRKLKSKVVDQGGDLNVDELTKAYEEGVKKIDTEITPISIDNSGYDHPELQQVKKVIQHVTKEGIDDDVMVDYAVSQPQNQRCPILGSAMVQPHKQVECGHVYSLPGIIEYMAQNNNQHRVNLSNIKTLDDLPENWFAKCPVHSCNKQLRRELLRRDYAAEVTQRQWLDSTAGGRDSLAGEDSMAVDVADYVE